MIELDHLLSTLLYLIITFFVLIIILCAYVKSKYYSVWSSRGLPGPTPLPFVGNVYEIYFYPFVEMFMSRGKKYGRMYGTYDGLTPALVVADPQLVKQVCVKDFHAFVNRRGVQSSDNVISSMITVARNEQWKRLRKIMSPTFSTGKIKRMKPLIDRCVRNAIDYLETAAGRKEEINLKQFWSRFTLEVIACCCFATEINSHKDPDNEFFKHVTALFRIPTLKQRIKTMLFFTLPTRISKLLGIDLFEKDSTRYLANVTSHILKQRRSSGGNYNDFLQLLLEAEQETDKTESPLTETEIVGNSILFFIAGYETTATLLNYCCYCLAMNPDIQEQLYDEITLHFKDGEITDYDLANKLPYLDAVICETLRMFPPFVFNNREASVEIEMGNTGVTIPAKSVVNIPVYSIHHDAEFYPEPEKFKPQRFLGENRDKIDPYTYLPFGVGPRNCVAMRFALIEAKSAIIQSVAKFRFVKNKRTTTPKFVKYTFFLICEDLFVDVHKRQ